MGGQPDGQTAWAGVVLSCPHAHGRGKWGSSMDASARVVWQPPPSRVAPRPDSTRRSIPTSLSCPAASCRCMVGRRSHPYHTLATCWMRAGGTSVTSGGSRTTHRARRPDLWVAELNGLRPPPRTGPAAFHWTLASRAWHRAGGGRRDHQTEPCEAILHKPPSTPLHLQSHLFFMCPATPTAGIPFNILSQPILASEAASLCSQAPATSPPSTHACLRLSARGAHVGTRPQAAPAQGQPVSRASPCSMIDCPSTLLCLVLEFTYLPNQLRVCAPAAWPGPARAGRLRRP